MTAANLYVPPQPIAWRGRALLRKYYADDDLTRVNGDPYGRTRATPYEVMEADNLLLTSGATLVLNRLAGITATPIDAANGRMCVGNGTTAVAAGQTDLQGASKTRKLLDAVPSVSGNQLQAVCTFTTADANHDWQEAALANAAAGATVVNRFLQNFGTKTNVLQWILTVTVTLN